MSVSPSRIYPHKGANAVKFEVPVSRMRKGILFGAVVSLLLVLGGKHEVFTVAYLNWIGMTNGQLLKCSRGSRFRCPESANLGLSLPLQKPLQWPKRQRRSRANIPASN
jgi:hypothetical protein